MAQAAAIADISPFSLAADKITQLDGASRQSRGEDVDDTLYQGADIESGLFKSQTPGLDL